MSAVNRESASVYAIGVLEEWERAALEARALSDADLDAEMLAFRETAAELALSVAIAPRPGLRDKLMARIRRPARYALPEVEPGIRVLRAGEGAWRETGFPGVTFQQLYVDPATDVATSMLRLEPGSVYPGHRHAREEQCYVIQGEAFVGDIPLREGDYERAEPGTVHSSLTTKTGCILLIIASRHDEFLHASR